MSAERRNTAPQMAPRSGFFSAFVEGRRGQILDAALQVFGEKGYEAGTMRSIATLVGVSEPALYRHYVGKEALLVDLIETAGERLAVTAVERFAEAEPGNIDTVLLQLVRERRELIRANFALMSSLLIASHHNANARDAFRDTLIRPMAAGVRTLIVRMDAERGVQRSPEGTDSKARTMMSLFVGHFLTSQFFETAPNDEDVIAALVTMMGWQGASS